MEVTSRRKSQPQVSSGPRSTVMSRMLYCAACAQTGSRSGRKSRSRPTAVGCGWGRSSRMGTASSTLGASRGGTRSLTATLTGRRLEKSQRVAISTTCVGSGTASTQPTSSRSREPRISREGRTLISGAANANAATPSPMPTSCGSGRCVCAGDATRAALCAINRPWPAILCASRRAESRMPVARARTASRLPQRMGARWGRTTQTKPIARMAIRTMERICTARHLGPGSAEPACAMVTAVLQQIGRVPMDRLTRRR